MKVKRPILVSVGFLTQYWRVKICPTTKVEVSKQLGPFGTSHMARNLWVVFFFSFFRIVWMLTHQVVDV